MSFKSRLMMYIQFSLGVMAFSCSPSVPTVQSDEVFWNLESYILNTCPSQAASHLSLLSLMMSSNFRNPVFLPISSFLTLSFHVIRLCCHSILFVRLSVCDVEVP